MSNLVEEFSYPAASGFEFSKLKCDSFFFFFFVVFVCFCFVFCFLFFGVIIRNILILLVRYHSESGLCKSLHSSVV